MEHIIQSLFNVTISQQGDNMRAYFTTDAQIRWHNTNEQFSVEEYIIANCEYPGSWNGCIERIEKSEKNWIVIAHVWKSDESLSFHVTSFYTFEDELVSQLDEYWSEDGIAPQWRLDKSIGKKIHS